jgi:uncharacterized membrane-anchored protein
MKTSTFGFFGVVAAQVFFLLGWAGKHEWLRRQGQVIHLQARPVDPSDLLRGDYMTLKYDIGQVVLPAELDMRSTGAHAKAGTPVWVILEPKGEEYVAVAASADKPSELQSDQVLVCGSLRWNDVAFGIERYFVPEGKGSPSFKKIDVEVTVSGDHRLYIKRLFLDGRLYP